MDDGICGFFVSVFCVCLLFASHYRHSSVDGKGKWAFEASKQASEQMLLGWVLPTSRTVVVRMRFVYILDERSIVKKVQGQIMQ